MFPYRLLCALPPSPHRCWADLGVMHTCWRTPAVPSGWRCGRASPTGSAWWSGKWWGAAEGSGLWRFGLSCHRRPKERGNLITVTSGKEKGRIIPLWSWAPISSLGSLRKRLKLRESHIPPPAPPQIWTCVLAPACSRHLQVTLWGHLGLRQPVWKH